MGEIIKIYIDKNRKIYANKRFRKYLFKFGVENRDKIYLNPYEAYYVFEKRNCLLIYNDQIIKEQSKIIELLNLDLVRYLVFKDLVERGYRIKINGDDWIVLDKYSKEPLWFLIIKNEFESLSPNDLIKLLKEKKSEGLKLLLAIVDIDGDITYYDFHLLKI